MTDGRDSTVAPPTSGRNKTARVRPYVAWGVLIVLITLVAYLPALRGGFVFDDTYVRDNPLLRADDGLYRIWFTTAPREYYPLTYSLWRIEWQLWGNNPTGYHVINVLLHALNAVLVWKILRHLKIPGAWLAGLIFAVHPVNAATAATISEQKNTLSMLFSGVAVLLHLKSDEDRRWRWYAFSLAVFLLALLSKTAVVMLPAALLGCLWWRHGRIGRNDLIRSAPFFVLSVVMGLVTIWFEHHRVLEGHEVRTASVASRLITAGWAPWFYLYKAVLPFNLMLIYPQWQVDPTRWINYVPGLVLIGWGGWLWWKRDSWRRPLLFGLGYFVVMLVPVLGFVDQSFYLYALVADHWQYYSIVGVIALAVAAGCQVCQRLGKASQLWGAAASVTVLLVLGAGTWKRSGVYANSETLWRDNVAKNPKAWVAHNNLGVALRRDGRVLEAIDQYEQAVQIKPDYAEAYNNLGVALWQEGRVPEATSRYERALRIKPDYAEAHNNLGGALEQAGNASEAVAQYQQAIQLQPNYLAAHYNLGRALERAGQTNGAIEQYEQALRINPDFSAAREGWTRLRPVP